MPTPQDTDARARRSSHGTAQRSRRRRNDTNGSNRISHARGNTGHTRGKKSRPRSLDGTTGSLKTNDMRRVRSSGAVGYTSAAGGRRAHGAHGRAKNSHAIPVWGVILVIVAVLLVGAGGFLLFRGFFGGQGGKGVAAGQEVTVVIPEGSLGNAIADELVNSGVLPDTKTFTQAVQELNADQSLRSGTYRFVTGSDPKAVVRQLMSGPNSGEGQLQVPEGYTTSQIADLVEKSLGIPRSDFLAQAKASNYVKDYPFLKEAANDSLEGFLYPKTYDLAGQDVTADTVIRCMLSQFETEKESFDIESARELIYKRYGLNATAYDLLKIASIVEKEVGSHEDAAKVASTIYNRLAKNMALQSDATMMYVTGGTVTASDLETDSPYNTYLYKGLTPTPVCSPSREAMEAALAPADTNYLYFLLIDDGDYHNHTFSETYEQHEAAIEKASSDRSSS